jgi:sulfate adenylyltransferase large subunit
MSAAVLKPRGDAALVPPPHASSGADAQEAGSRLAEKELLRFVAVGSVDDGKSTLIGRLLHDAHGVYEDQLRSVKRASQMAGAEIDFSLFTDGLKAEREQGITIDVSYRYFATAKRKFIIADTPGHVQYTRNMATGASTAGVAIILIDARLGVLQQSRRHAYIASLLGIPYLVVGVNKMDLVAYAEAAFDAVRTEFAAFTEKLGFKDVSFIPMSALRGDNVVARSEKMPFYDGPTVLERLEEVPIDADRNLEDFRFPVQIVLRPNLDYRGYAAQIASGVVRPGDAVMVLPSKKTSRIAGIDAYGEELAAAFAPMSVTLRLADEIDVSRGDMIVHVANVPRVTQRLDAMIVWLHERPLDRAKSYLLKHTTQTVRTEVEAIRFQVDLETLESVPAERLGLNDIGRITLATHRPLFVDPYSTNRATGAFILIDSLTNDTVAAGMILEQDDAQARQDPQGTASFDHTQVSPHERRERIGHAPAVVIVKGGRALAFAIERAFFDRGLVSVVVVGAHAAAAAAACVEAGVVAVCAVDEATAADLVARIAADRVIDAGADVESALRALETRGILGTASA